MDLEGYSEYALAFMAKLSDVVGRRLYPPNAILFARSHAAEGATLFRSTFNITQSSETPRACVDSPRRAQ